MSGRCFSHGKNRRLIIQTEGYEYYECPVCGTREADQIYGTEGDYPVNQSWLNGASWFT
ncbi:MAG: hypothetical protein Q8P76_02930 [bacterium]|nr:hypothetical protein [bacterium]